jgi:hypothetical protein
LERVKYLSNDLVAGPVVCPLNAYLRLSDILQTPWVIIAYPISCLHAKSLRRWFGVDVARHFVGVYVLHRVVAVALSDGDSLALWFSIDVNLVDEGMAYCQFGGE